MTLGSIRRSDSDKVRVVSRNNDDEQLGFTRRLDSDKVRVVSRNNDDEQSELKGVGRQIRQDGEGSNWLLFALFETWGFNLDVPRQFATHSSRRDIPLDDDDDDDEGLCDDDDLDEVRSCG